MPLLTTTAMTMTMAAAVAATTAVARMMETAAVTHRQQWTKSNGQSTKRNTTINYKLQRTATAIATAMTMGSDDDNDSGGRRVMGCQVWGGVRRSKVAEMGIKQKLEQCGYYDKRKLLLVKLFGGFIFICTL